MTEILVPPGTAAIIFDCDGTLADTHALHQEAWDECLAAHRLDTPPNFLDNYKGVPTTEILKAFNSRFKTSLDVALVAEEKERIAFSKLRDAKPILPVVNVVRRYNGVLPMAAASGGTAENVFRTLEAIGLRECFDVVLTADDPVRGKPFPDIFLEAARRLGADPSRCLVFEDSPLGIEAAQKAGMAFIDVTKHL